MKRKNVLCCGIHTTGYPNANGAVRVTDEVLQEIEKWIKYLHEH
jgi:V8-like Glu-specific endopeptidase